MRSQVYIYPFITLFQKVIIMNCIKEKKNILIQSYFQKNCFNYIFYMCGKKYFITAK